LLETKQIVGKPYKFAGGKFDRNALLANFDNVERQRAEADVLRQALAQCASNLSQAARLLGISRPTLYDLLRQHGIPIRRRRRSTPVVPDPDKT
jgi:transcriptional regulator of acetoin/glycerol metabolism